MNRTVFLDVGGNTGQSIEAALDFDFDIIYSFEPVKEYYEMLETGVLSSDRVGFAPYIKKPYDKSKVVICPFGLWVKDEVITIYSPHTMAASVFSDHQDNEGGQEDCNFVDTSQWFQKNLNHDDFVVMKMNCEGSECTILDHLMAQDCIDLVDHIMIDFDAFKIPSQSNRPQQTVNNLHARGVDYVLCDDVMHGRTHYDKICHWLEKEVPLVNRIKCEDK